jgi:hypothetical protein
LRRGSMKRIVRELVRSDAKRERREAGDVARIEE